jgi:hypothetical protein
MSSTTYKAPHPGFSVVRGRPDTSGAGAAVYHGSERAGHTITRDYGFEARDRRGRLLGDFATEREAVTAILAAAVSS